MMPPEKPAKTEPDDLFDEEIVDDDLDDDIPDPILRERYARLQAELANADHTELLKKLRAPSPFFPDDEDSEA